jgi:hypothetical protein
VKRASPTLGTSHAYGSGTSVLVLGRHALLPSPPGMTRWSYEEYHTTPVLRRSAVGHWDGATGSRFPQPGEVCRHSRQRS